MGYQYPIDETWTKEEVIDVVNFFRLVEQGYEKNVKRDELMMLYKRFKQIVPSKSEEKKLFSTFETASGYSSYHLIKEARESNERVIRMK